MVFSRITIIRIASTGHRDVNEELQMLGGALGLFNLRDKDKSCFRIFITLLKEVKAEGLTSDELALKTGLTRGTVVHHLNRLMAAGIVEGHRSRYALTVSSLSELLNRVEQNVTKSIEELRTTAKDLDDRLGLRS